MNWIVNPRYSGDTMYPTPPSRAVPMPHLMAPETAPRVASQEASTASSCFVSLAEGILSCSSPFFVLGQRAGTERRDGKG